ncbi:transcription-repair coupling factor [Candidatus Erwinia haradaeae]|uniref:Transcription-repair-coupling factor n=1 Tax=Candidatus Erwinia haradaeae TaxID=1922217 RepID=A0A451DH10_9GAMM|nr:transcription-repair coupling factor [Candidatus Erwinia haradaeae]VFP85913.1 Transcription-repair-coupling factor [Candidatus Erwinia haradaeae]
MPELYCYDLPCRAGDQRHLGQLTGAAYSIECSEIAERHNGPVMIVTQDIKNARLLFEEIKNFTNQIVMQFSDWGTLPFDSFSPDKAIISSRLSMLYDLPTLKNGIIIVSINTLMQRVCPYNFLVNTACVIKINQILTHDQLLTQLKQIGYRGVYRVMEHGEFSNDGEFWYIYPMGSSKICRVSLFNNQINRLHLFESENQLFSEEITKINLLPSHEFPVNDDVLELFIKKWFKNFNINKESNYIYEQVKKGILPAGVEYWQPLFFEKQLPGLFSYLPTNTLILITADIEISSQRFWKDLQHRYRACYTNVMRPPLAPKFLWFSSDEFLREFKHWPSIQLNAKRLKENFYNTNLEYSSLPGFKIDVTSKKPLDRLRQFLSSFRGQVVFSVQSEGRREVLQERLAGISVRLTIINSLAQARESGKYLLISSSEVGFIDHRRKRAFICERDLLNDNVVAPYCQKAPYNIDSNIFLQNLSEMYLGQPVVHIEHGIGRYMGLIVLETNGISVEYLILMYAEDAKLYVPISSLHLISRYMGGSGSEAPLHKLGRDTWSRVRQKAVEQVRDVAVELLDIYAHRAAKIGFAFKKDLEQYQLFCESFPFVATIDQAEAINEVLRDMCQPVSMDRLICGDVGFGKTEVAMRAAFLAVINHKQVAVLVPTTLLAQQHYDNFLDRFASWPVSIKMLSRFRTDKEQSQILTDVLIGQVDILIGTHKLLQNKIKWHDLGLLIIDEEHRFGVRHKERIKLIRANVDVLTLTATPIPRTLNMAMHGIRNLSIISTPPARRLPVKTFVHEYDKRIVYEAILREVLRGGQAYYLYNDVENIEKVTRQLSELVPQARIALGHGKMRERELEKVMHDFYHQRFNVLVCTTIIETGIDIPSANTIIIERADRFGLAQLYQLRGRVGRSHHQAYAWLLTPNQKEMTSNAHKRLEAILAIEDLGAGLSLATHDLEIRGAGELLGEGQSGQIEGIGFSLYTELLENTVNALQIGREPSLADLINTQTDIELRIPALIPSNFISNVNTRLLFYQRIASAKELDVIKNIKIELINRFGLLPDSTRTLLDISALRILAKQFGIRKVEVNEKGGWIELDKNNRVNTKWFLDLLKKEPYSWFLDSPIRIRFIYNLSDPKIRLQWITALIHKICDYNTAQ